MSHLEIRDLTIEYTQGEYLVRPIDSLNVDADDGELVILLGPSGCGKTTLLSCLAAPVSDRPSTPYTNGHEPDRQRRAPGVTGLGHGAALAPCGHGGRGPRTPGRSTVPA